MKCAESTIGMVFAMPVVSLVPVVPVVPLVHVVSAIPVVPVVSVVPVVPVVPCGACGVANTAPCVHTEVTLFSGSPHLGVRQGEKEVKR